MTKKLTAIIEREGDGYVALCPELDIASQGDTVGEARNNLQEALELFYVSKFQVKKYLYLLNQNPKTSYQIQETNLTKHLLRTTLEKQRLLAKAFQES